MKRRHAVLGLAAALLTGCSDVQTPVGPVRTEGTQPVTTAQTLHGTVILDPAHRVQPALGLLLDDGTVIGLDGQEAQALASVIGATVEVQAAPSGDSIVDVQRFIVLTVDGKDVSDGILQLTDDGTYSLQLTAGGTRAVVNPPDALAAHVGERVWLTQDDGSGPQAFGVIQA